jgi:catechol 2,3-dioxygenase-like lactoylglutathione lyase family enzyme
MLNTLDHLIVAVADLDKAEKNYSTVFGVDPVWRGEHVEYGTENSLFNFNNTYFELLAAKGDGLGAMLVNHTLQETGEGLIGIVFGTDNLKETHQTLSDKGFLLGDVSNGEGANFKNNKIRKWKNLFLPPELTRGIFSFLIEHTEGALPTVDRFEPSMVNKLDHVVINTNDADGFINIYKDFFNMRLALDKFVDEWKSRMLFFRLNQTTIEVIEKKNDEEPKDSLWGLSWEVDNIEEAHKRLEKAGVEITPIKKGIKENTMVATIKSHTHNVPTLLIEHTLPSTEVS